MPKEGANMLPLWHNGSHKRLTYLTPNIQPIVINSRTSGIHCPLVVFLFVFLTAATHLVIEPGDCQQPSSHQQLSFSSQNQADSDKTRTNTTVGAVEYQKKQWTSNNNRQSTIPAANPNFEAAFQGECGKNNNSNPCEHICLDLHDGTYECSCFYGFMLAVDGYSCASIQQQQSLARTLPVRAGTVAQVGPEKPSLPHESSNSSASKAIDSDDDDDDYNNNGPTGTTSPEDVGSVEGDGRRANDNRKLVDELARGGGIESLVNGNGNENDDDPSSAKLEESGDSNQRQSSRHGQQQQRKRLGQPTYDAPSEETASLLHKVVSAVASKGSKKKPFGGISSKQNTTNMLRPQTATRRPITERSNFHFHRHNHHHQQQQQQTSKSTGRLHKGSAGDKLVSYDLSVVNGDDQDEEEDSARSAGKSRPLNNNNNNPGRDGEFIELNIGGYDPDILLDPDIRSIMVSNDRLVKQLASTVLQQAEQQQQLQSDSFEEGGDDDEPSVDYDGDLGQLEDLVRKTIEDYSLMRPPTTSNQTTATSEPDQLTSTRINEASMGKAASMKQTSNSVPSLNRSLSDLDDEQPRSRPVDSRERRRRRHDHHKPPQQLKQLSEVSTSEVFTDYDSTNMVHQTTNQALNDRPYQDIAGFESCALTETTDKQSAQRVYTNCDELSECESGGRCTVETVWISSLYSDLARLERRARCRCPIGRGGRLCQKPLQRHIPRFMGHSYLALPMITDRSLSNLRLVFRPERRRLGMVDDDDGNNNDTSPASTGTLMLYSQKFLLLLDSFGRIELRYLTIERDNSGGGAFNGPAAAAAAAHDKQAYEITRVIGSRDVQLDQWNELIVTDATSDGDDNNYNPQNDDNSISTVNRIVLVTPEKIQLLGERQETTTTSDEYSSSGSLSESDDNETKHSELFVAGIPDAVRANLRATRVRHNGQLAEFPGLLDASLANGLVGCIRELSLNERVYSFRSDLNGDTLDGFDIAECCR